MKFAVWVTLSTAHANNTTHQLEYELCLHTTLHHSALKCVLYVSLKVHRLQPRLLFIKRLGSAGQGFSFVVQNLHSYH